MTTESQKEAKRRYEKENTKMYCFKLNKKYDADIMEHLEGIKNRQGYIKDLIRKNIKEAK